MNELTSDTKFEQALKELGILKWGITSENRAESYPQFNHWIDQKLNLPLDYLAGERGEKREQLTSVFPKFQSAFVFLFSYAEIRKSLEQFYASDESNKLKIASYVLGFKGLDYHLVLLEKLKKVQELILEKYPNANFQHSLDIQPILERDLAYRAGLGWFGKNSMLINQEVGSFFIIGSLLTDIKINEEATPLLDTDHCGNCTDCVDACPTDAIDVATRTLIGSKCISTYTIEVFHPDRMEPPQKMEEGAGEIYGCDICQDVCPWNKKYLKSLPTKLLSELIPEENKKIVEFFMSRPLDEIILELEEMSNKKFEKNFKSTPLARTRRLGLLKNLKFWSKLDRDL